jgi:adenosylcobyric acid synthase
LPYLHGLSLAAEDALPRGASAATAKFNIIIPALPRISNHTDFDALRLNPLVNLQFVAPDAAPPAADLIILPGSKSVRADLAWLRQQGWDSAIHKHLRYGGKIIGICGGLQMLGNAIHDPLGIESAAGSSAGLGLLDFATTLAADKQLCNVSGTLSLNAAPIVGYEIHAGITSGVALTHPAAYLSDGRTDGAISSDDQILASYVHGLFDTPASCDALLAWAGLCHAASPDLHAMYETSLNRLADNIETHLDIAKLKIWLKI